MRALFWGLFAALILVRVPTVAQPAGADQGLYAYVGQRILAGEMPYRDAWDQKPPAIHYTYAVMYALFPHDAIVPATDLIEEALKVAAEIAEMPPLAAIAVKEMVNAAFEGGLAQGVTFERRLFHGLFGTADQKEGMTAFVEKRPGNWTGK